MKWLVCFKQVISLAQRCSHTGTINYRLPAKRVRAFWLYSSLLSQHKKTAASTAAHMAISVQTPRAIKLHYHREGIRYTDAPETTQFTKHLKAFQPMSYYWQNLKNTGESQFVLFLWVPKFKAELCHLWYQHDQKLLLQTGFSNSKMLGFGRKKKHFPIPFHFLNKGIDF